MILENDVKGLIVGEMGSSLLRLRAQEYGRPRSLSPQRRPSLGFASWRPSCLHDARLEITDLVNTQISLQRHSVSSRICGCKVEYLLAILPCRKECRFHIMVRDFVHKSRGRARARFVGGTRPLFNECCQRCLWNARSKCERSTRSRFFGAVLDEVIANPLNALRCLTSLNRALILTPITR